MTFKQPVNIPIDGEKFGLNKNRSYELVETYTAAVQRSDGSEFKIIVPKGFKYDGASVPRIFWTLVGFLPDGKGRAAALIHDYLYEFKGKPPEGHLLIKDESGEWVNYEGRWTRKQSDDLFLDLLVKGGVPFIRRNLAHRAVRLAGWYPWKKD